MVESEARSARIRARLPNPDRKQGRNMLMTVSIETAPRETPGVPELAVVSAGDARYVFVIGPGGKLKRTAITSGARQNGMDEVTDGLRPGQKVVGGGVGKVAAGLDERVAGPGGVGKATAR